jgi:hypothetical protein
MPDPAGDRARVGREQAEQSVAARFSRLMNATTSRWGALSDPAIAGVPTAVFFVAFLAARSRELDPGVISALGVLSLVPAAVALVATLALSGARRRVVEWLATLPFPLENVNGLLNGIGAELEVRFAGEPRRGVDPAPGGDDPAATPAWPPSREELNALFEAVSPDVFVTTIAEDERVLSVRIGVVDSKFNPARTNHQRYARVRAICDAVLVPLSARMPIVVARVT